MALFVAKYQDCRPLFHQEQVVFMLLYPFIVVCWPTNFLFVFSWLLLLVFLYQKGKICTLPKI
uniref:Uncharacterized protein n=1 Tax=Rhizophora mucronata TaxID=61149 RepID=A0A2P2LDV1_RHIMU